jgi:uncharacterized membrane protein YhaH (DUF805 family)
MKYLIEPFKRCFIFSGRSSRKEYWLFVLWAIIIFIIALTVVIITQSLFTESLSNRIDKLQNIFGIVFLLPQLSIGVRRLHDIDKSGWDMIIGFIPLANLFLLALLARKSTLTIESNDILSR